MTLCRHSNPVHCECVYELSNRNKDNTRNRYIHTAARKRLRLLNRRIECIERTPAIADCSCSVCRHLLTLRLHFLILTNDYRAIEPQNTLIAIDGMSRVLLRRRIRNAKINQNRIIRCVHRNQNQLTMNGKTPPQLRIQH